VADWDYTPEHLHSFLIMMALRAHCFIQYRIWYTLEQDPFWVLVSGDIEAGLDALMAGANPEDEILSKIWSLLTLGYPRPRVVEALRLCRLAPWTSKCIEEGHGIAAASHREHPMCNDDTLAKRATMGACVSLARPEKDPFPYVTRLKRTAVQLEKPAASHYGGQQMYIGTSVALAARQKRVGNEPWSPGASRDVFGRTSADWHDVPERERLPFEHAAKKRRVMAERERADDRAEARSALNLAVASRNAQMKDAQPMIRMKSCRWSPADRAELQRLWNGEEFPGAVVQPLRRLRQVLPDPQSAEMRALEPYLRSGPSVKLPALTRDQYLLTQPLAAYREVFLRTALCVDNEGEDTCYAAFGFAVKSPLRAWFTPLRLLPRNHYLRAGSLDVAGVVDAARREHRWNFAVGDGAPLCERDLPLRAGSTIRLIQELKWSRGRAGYSDISSVLFAAFVAELPPPPEQPEAEPHPAPRLPVQREPDWYRYYRDPANFGGHGGGGAHARGHRDREVRRVAPDPVVVSEDAMDAHLRAARAYQAELAETHEYMPSLHWELKVQQSRGNLAARGVLADSTRALARSREAIAFCKKFFPTQSADFYYSVYPSRYGKVLARYWIHRVDYFFVLAGGSVAYRFTAAEIDAYRAPAWLDRDLEGCGDVVSRRRDQITQHVVPRIL